MPDAPERCPDCGVGLQHPGTDKWMPIEQGTTAHTRERCLEVQRDAARAEAERWRKKYEALEAFAQAEKAVREHGSTCVYLEWEPGACPGGVCKELLRAREAAYQRALAAINPEEGGATDGR